MNSNHLTTLVSVASVMLVFTGCKKKEEAQSTSTTPVARCTHAVGLCNLPLFIAAEDQHDPSYQVRIELTAVPDWGKHALALQKGDVEFSVTPFTNVMVAYASGVPLRVIAGSGMNGLRLVTAKEIRSASDLRGKKVGTFRSDTLELMLFTYLDRNGLSYDDIELIYYDDGFQLVTAFRTAKVDAMTHVEPYAQKALRDRESHILATGEGPEVWDQDHPDCVLVTTANSLKDEPEKCKRMIRAMLEAERTINRNPEKAARRTASKYFRADEEDIVFAGKSQRPRVDILKSEEFMRSRFEDLKRLGQIPRDAAFDGLLALELLAEVVKEQDSGAGG